MTSQLLVGGLFGAVSLFLIMYLYFRARHGLSREAAEALRNEKLALERELRYQSQKERDMDGEIIALRKELNGEREKVLGLTRALSIKQTEYEGLKKKLDEQKAEVEQLQDHFRVQFKNLANEILEEKTRRFTEQNRINIGDILNPLKERINEFQKKVEEVNKESIDRNSALKQQIIGLRELNQQITREAENLTRALKGESKTRGNWGELILERILEKSGLEKGREYDIQESVLSTSGRRLQPDVVIRLPDDRKIIVDSKVSLVDYERYVNEDDEQGKAQCLKDHLNSVRGHIKSLGEKNYQHLYGVSGLDFVLLFMPIEPAFSLAVQNDDQLFQDAYDKNIVIVSPSTLIATLRTIASIWRQEKQNRYALEIAEQGGKLYDKFKSFTDDLVKIGDGLNGTKKSYDAAMNKLSDGKDNLIRKTERLKELGAKATKSMDHRLIKKGMDE